jgi:hypothetical protein
MRRFGFPDSLVAVAAYHHRPAEAPCHRTSIELIQMCSETASCCGYSVVPSPVTAAAEDDLCLYLRERMIETERGLAA